MDSSRARDLSYARVNWTDGYRRSAGETPVIGSNCPFTSNDSYENRLPLGITSRSASEANGEFTKLLMRDGSSLSSRLIDVFVNARG